MARCLFRTESVGHLNIVHVIGTVDAARCGELQSIVQRGLSFEGPFFIGCLEATSVAAECLEMLADVARRFPNRIRVIAYSASEIARALHRLDSGEPAIFERFAEAMADVQTKRGRELVTS